MSAPATNVRPPPIRMAARTVGSLSICSIASEIPSGTPGLSAFTGGFLIVIIAISLSRVSWTRSLSLARLSYLGGLIAARVTSYINRAWEHCPILACILLTWWRRSTGRVAARKDDSNLDERVRVGESENTLSPTLFRKAGQN